MIKPVNPKGNQPRYSLEGLMLGNFVGKRRRGQQKMRWLDGIIDLKDMNVSKPQDIVEDRESWCAAWGPKESDTT